MHPFILTNTARHTFAAMKRCPAQLLLRTGVALRRIDLGELTGRLYENRPLRPAWTQGAESAGNQTKRLVDGR